MNTELKNFINEYSNILSIYLSKSESAKTIDLVFAGYSMKSKSNHTNTLLNNSYGIRSVIDRIITYTEKKLTSKKHLRLLLNLAKLSLSRGELFLSADIYGQVLYRTTGSDKLLEETAEAFKGLGEISSNQAKWKESFSYVRKAKKIFENLNNTLGVANCENLLGAFHAEKGEIELSIEHFNSALLKLKGKRKTIIDAKIYDNLGIVNTIIGNKVEAEKNYKAALTKFEKTKDHIHIAEVRHNLGILASKLGNHKTALKQFDISIKVSSKINYLLMLAISYLGKAHLYTEMNDLDTAAEYIEKAVELSSQLNDRLTIADIYKVKGIIERKKGNYELAENYFLTSLRINSELGNKLNHSETSYELGLLYFELNQSQNSIKYLNKALKYFKKINALYEIKKIESLLKN